MGRKNVVPVRLSDEVYALISEYALFMEMRKSEALRELIKEGLLKKMHANFIKKWKQLCEKKDIITIKECEKCGYHTTKIYHIDGNVMNWNPENLVALCENCLNKLRKSMQDYNIKEEFISWFFLNP